MLTTLLELHLDMGVTGWPQQTLCILCWEPDVKLYVWTHTCKTKHLCCYCAWNEFRISFPNLGLRRILSEIKNETNFLSITVGIIPQADHSKSHVIPLQANESKRQCHISKLRTDNAVRWMTWAFCGFRFAANFVFIKKWCCCFSKMDKWN